MRRERGGRHHDQWKGWRASLFHECQDQHQLIQKSTFLSLVERIPLPVGCATVPLLFFPRSWGSGSPSLLGENHKPPRTPRKRKPPTPTLRRNADSNPTRNLDPVLLPRHIFLQSRQGLARLLHHIGWCCHSFLSILVMLPFLLPKQSWYDNSFLHNYHSNYFEKHHVFMSQRMETGII